MITIERAKTVDDPQEMKTILAEYLTSARTALIDAGIPYFEIDELIRHTMTDLPSYLPPKGAIFTARDPEGRLVGIVFQRMIRPKVAEIKRLYVRDAGRGTGLGKALVAAVIDEARLVGARRLFLDTVTTMTAALALYRGLAFTEIDRFEEAQNPPEVWPVAVYMALDL